MPLQEIAGAVMTTRVLLYPFAPVFAFVLAGLAIRHGLKHGNTKTKERP